MAGTLNSKVTLITGGGSGIGGPLLLHLSEQGRRSWSPTITPRVASAP